MILMPESCTIRVTFLLGCMRDKRDKATQLCELKNLAHHYEKIKKKKDKSTAHASQKRTTFTSTQKK